MRQDADCLHRTLIHLDESPLWVCDECEEERPIAEWHRIKRLPYHLPCPKCAGPIDESTIYHAVETIDPDISNATMLAENADCPDCGDVYLRNASGDF